MSNKIDYIINDLYDGKNAESLAIRRGLVQKIYDYLFIKRVVWSAKHDKLCINNLLNDEFKQEVVNPNSWVYAFRVGSKVIVITKPLPFNRNAEEASHRLRVKHNNF
jgi:hypothetical protein